MTNYVMCPECDKRAEVIPIQKPLEPGVSELTNNVGFAASTTFTCSSYPPTSIIYKCINPKCWVTKIKVMWD